MVHSVSGCTRVVRVKLQDPLRTRAIPERLRGVITTRCYINPRLPLPLPLTKLEKVAIRDALPLEAALRASHTWLLKIPRLAAWTQNALAAQFG